MKFFILAVNSIDKSFVTTACWVQGLYVYKEMFHRTSDSAYYGIPKDVDSDGVSETGALCSVLEKTKYNTSCFAMEKIFFLQVSALLVTGMLQVCIYCLVSSVFIVQFCISKEKVFKYRIGKKLSLAFSNQSR